LIYVLVLFGSLFIICAVLGVRVLLRHRSIRIYVRSVQHRVQQAESRGIVFVEETHVERAKRDPRTSAIAMQKVRSLTREAEKAIARGNIADAEALFIQALTLNSRAYEVQAQLAKLYLSTERAAKAEAMYRELLRQCQDVSFYANLGVAYYRQGKYVGACKAYQAALNLDPKNPERSAALGRACIAAHRYQDAVPLLEKALIRLSRDTALLHLLAECYMQLGLTMKAEETYRRINKLEPYDEEVKAKLAKLAIS